MTRDEIIVRWIATDRIMPRHRAALEALLDPAETAHAARFRFDEDRLAFVAAKALTRAILTLLVKRPPHSWQFRKGPFGKPEPILWSGEPAVCFNLSHTKGLAVVAASIGREIGVDAEWIGRPAPLEIAETHFAPEELTQIYDHMPKHRDETFFKLWTLKEAYMKATGKGIHLALNSFAFGLDPIRLLSSAEAGESARWRFQVRRIGANHMLALAADRPDACPLLISQKPASLDWIAALSQAKCPSEIILSV